MFICDDEHDEIDKPGSRDAFSVEMLERLKRDHEERILHVTGLAPDRSTTILRMVAALRGTAIELDRDEVARAVLASGRFPRFPLAFDRQSLEIDLRSIAGEDAAGPDYYQAATAQIDELVDRTLRDGVLRGAINHLSVFGFARVPLLVYLGSKLDDGVATDVYQRHRASEGWGWPEGGGATGFEIDRSSTGRGSEEGVLVLNVSGTIQEHELPAAVVGLPVFSLTTIGTPTPDAIQNGDGLKAFEGSVRQLLGALEADYKSIRRLHVFAALPVSAAVTLGRSLDPAVHPSLVLYDRTSGGYVAALEVG